MLTIKKKKEGNPSIASKDIEANEQTTASNGAGLMGLSANLSALKKPKDASATTGSMGVELPKAKDEPMSKGHSSAYLERVKKRAK